MFWGEYAALSCLFFFIIPVSDKGGREMTLLNCCLLGALMKLLNLSLFKLTILLSLRILFCKRYVGNSRYQENPAPFLSFSNLEFFITCALCMRTAEIYMYGLWIHVDSLKNIREERESLSVKCNIIVASLSKVADDFHWLLLHY